MSKKLKFLYSILPSLSGNDAREVLEEIDQLEKKIAKRSMATKKSFKDDTK